MRFTRKGYGRLLRHDGTLVSQHVVPEEAYESAAREGEGSYTWQPAPISIVVEPHDCEAPTPAPAPEPAPVPAPAPEPEPAPAPPPELPPAPAPVGGLPVGELQHDGPATPEQVSLYLPITGELGYAARASVRYHDGHAWREAHPLVRQRPDFAISSGATAFPEQAFAGVIVDLQPGAQYLVEVTVSLGEETAVRSLQWTTRALPAEAGPPTVVIPAGSTEAQISGAINGAQPGDVVEFEPGEYVVSGLQITCKGTAEAPIYIRGRSRDSVTIRDVDGKSLYIVGGRHLVIEDLTIVGSESDGGLDKVSTGIWVWNGARHERITVRRCLIRGVDRGVIAWGAGSQLLVYDNVLAGNNPWEKSVTESNLSWNDDGIMAAGEGNSVFNNTLSGFGDAFCVNAGYSNIGVHFYRNRVLWSCDDGFEADYGARNLTFYDNRLANTMTMISCDPLRIGPLFAFRNVAINVGRQPFKLNSTLTGLFLYSNTIVRQLGMDTIAGTYQPGSSGHIKFRGWGFRNNLFLCMTPALANTLWWETSANDPIDVTHNAWFPDARFRWNYSGGNFNSLAEAQAGLPATAPVFSGETQRHAHDIISEPHPFRDPVTLGATYDVRVDGDHAVIPAEGSVVRGAGVAIPGITDGYAGDAPDIGAVITGRGAPAIGARW